MAIPDYQSGQLVQVPVPPDLAQLASIAGPTGGRAVPARSAAELNAAVDDLASRAGLIGEPRDLTLLFAAAALLLLLAIAGALSPRRRPAPDSRIGEPAAVWWRLAPSASTALLLAAAAATVAAWSLWVAPAPLSKPPKPGAAAAAAALISSVTAVLLAHEQEHCIRNPDDRETPAVDEEARLARKLGKARLIEYVTASYSDLDKTGHWQR